jgi:hypothetical protein
MAKVHTIVDVKVPLEHYVDVPIMVEICTRECSSPRPLGTTGVCTRECKLALSVRREIAFAIVEQQPIEFVVCNRTHLSVLHRGRALEIA